MTDRNDKPDPRAAGHGTAAAVRVKIGDVAAAAGVHPSTVSRVLRATPDNRVSPAVATRVRETAKRLGYRPDAVAASMRTRSTRTIGVIVHDIADPVYSPILRAIETALLKAGYMTVIGNTGYDPQAEAAMFEQMASRMVDGVILGTTRLSDPVVDRAVQARVPIVSVLRQTASDVCSSVVNDCGRGMKALVDAIVARGHRDIAAIGAPQHLSTGKERLDSLRDGLAAHGLALQPERLVFVEHMDVEGGVAATRILLDRDSTPPQAIVGVNDLVAIGALKACRERGLECPKDVSITGYNDIPLVDMIYPSLTTVAIDLTKIGTCSAKILMKQLDDPGRAIESIRIPPVLKLRESLGDARQRP